MRLSDRALIIQQVLNELYPTPKIPLNHINEFTFLIAVVLSAQSTDKKVNELTQSLFLLAKEPQEIIDLGYDKVYDSIKYLGLAKTKAKNIISLSNQLLQRHKGYVPNTFEELESLSGVGHKTASVVMSQVFNYPAFPVDTHIHRLAQRWGLTNGKNVKTTEQDLKRIFPKDSWNKLHLQIIFYGREFCTARKCDGRVCQLCTTLFPKRTKPFIHIKA